MFTKTVVAAMCLLAVLSFTVCASGAWAKAEDLVLKEAKTHEEVKDGTEVSAGWFVGVEPKGIEPFSCELLPQTYSESLDFQPHEGKMRLETNKSRKDEAKGTVTAPRCYSTTELAELRSRIKQEEEAAKGGSSPIRPRPRTSPSEYTTGTAPAMAAPSSEDSGELVLQEVDSTKRGTIKLSKPFVISFEDGGVTCTYESATKISAKWPPKYEGEEIKKEEEEFPNLEKTGNLTAKIKLKASKTNPKKGCAKDEDASIETWLGPLGEELETELIS
jgi:hypothetical protein